MESKLVARRRFIFFVMESYHSMAVLLSPSFLSSSMSFVSKKILEKRKSCHKSWSSRFLKGRAERGFARLELSD